MNNLVKIINFIWSVLLCVFPRQRVGGLNRQAPCQILPSMIYLFKILNLCHYHIIYIDVCVFFWVGVKAKPARISEILQNVNPFSAFYPQNPHKSPYSKGLRLIFAFEAISPALSNTHNTPYPLDIVTQYTRHALPACQPLPLVFFMVSYIGPIKNHDLKHEAQKTANLKKLYLLSP